MIKRIIFSGIFLLSILAFSQNGKVGIGTTSPQQVLHIDAAKNTPAGSTTTNISDDVVITSQGYMGIGTTTPSKRLEIQSATTRAIRIADGTQQTNAFLQSDANGVGTWYIQGSIKPIVLGAFGDSSTGSDATSGAYKDLKVSITLTPGTWMVNFGATLKMNNTITTPFWMHLWLSDTPGGKTNKNFTFLGAAQSNTGYAGLMIPNQISTVGNANLLNGSTIIQVGSTTPTTTIWVTAENLHKTTAPTQNWNFTSTNWENYFYAIPLDGN